jgi:hypothetical protein
MRPDPFIDSILVRILPVTLLVIQLGCTPAPTASGQTNVRQSWERDTRIESAWYEPSYPVVLRYSNGWTFKKSGEAEASINVQGVVALTYRKGHVDVTRGLYLFVAPSKDSSTFGDAYVDLDELPDFIAALDRFSEPEKVSELRGDSSVGMTFGTKGRLHFRTGSILPGFVIGARKTDSRSEETSLSQLTKADLAEFKLKLELAKQWTERQVP